VTAGYIFDLRVHDSYQRLGLGYKLSQQLEEIAKEKGCSFLYLSVNSTNKKKSCGIV